jgi:phage tail-like protein
MVFGKPRSYHKKFKFVVEVDGFSSAKFIRASGLEPEIAITAHYEGGALIPDKSPARVTVPPVVLERGATADQEMYDWFVEVANIAANSGLVDPQYKRMVDIVQLDRDGTKLRRWRLHNAFPTKFVPGDWDNDSDDAVIESITLEYDYPELINLEAA